MGLEGKVAVVTGGARGIGRAYCEGLVAQGAAVLIADVLEAEGREAQTAITAAGGRAIFQRTDVTDPASVEAMANTAASEFGGVDILVNNAAMFASLRGGSLMDISVERWERTMAVNVKGPWLCIKAVVPHMRKRGGGAVVNISSISAYGIPGMLDYTTPKAGVTGMTKNAAKEPAADNIRVNAIAPGGTATEALAEISGGRPHERAANQSIGGPLMPEDMVGTMLYLVGDGSKLVTGQTLVVDGGRYFLG